MQVVVLFLDETHPLDVAVCSADRPVPFFPAAGLDPAVVPVRISADDPLLVIEWLAADLLRNLTRQWVRQMQYRHAHRLADHDEEAGVERVDQDRWRQSVHRAAVVERVVVPGRNRRMVYPRLLNACRQSGRHLDLVLLTGYDRETLRCYAMVAIHLRTQIDGEFAALILRLEQELILAPRLAGPTYLVCFFVRQQQPVWSPGPLCS